MPMSSDTERFNTANPMIRPMSFVDLIINNLIGFIYLVDLLLIFIMLFWERSSSKNTLLWVVLMIFLPLVGFVLYLFFGQTFYSAKTFGKKALRDHALAEMLNKENRIMDDELERYPQNAEKINFAKTIRNAGGYAYTNSNSVTLLSDSQRYFDSLLDDLRSAKTSIDFEYYIIRNDDISNELMDVLVDRVRNGVKVRVMIDALGNNKGPNRRIREFKRAGGEFALFHSTLTCLLSPRKNNRNHRKIAVVDGKTAYIGGYNIGDEYLGLGKFGYWRDCAVRIVGPEVPVLRVRFLADWIYATKRTLPAEDDITDYVRDAGDTSLQIVSGGPDMGSNPIHMQYFNIVSNAKRTMYIHTPYLEPDESLTDCLRKAAFSGVDVRIIIPDKADHPFVYWANRYFASILMKAGVKIYEYNRGFVHSKTMVGDGYYCSVGSANFDDRSMKLNFESNAMIYSAKIGQEMNEVFMDDLEYCTEYTLEKYRSRTVFQKLKTSISKLASSQL